MEILTTTWSVPVAAGTLLAASAVLTVFGSRLARVVDRLADRTGLGEAIAGAVLLGAVTSIAGLVVSIVAARQGDASLAVSNSIGGVAAQTAFIVVADLAYRRANLEHAAASIGNLFNSTLMVVLLSVVLIGVATPPVTFLGVHPASAVLLLAYGYGVWISRRIREDPMWRPMETDETREDMPDQPSPGETVPGLWFRFVWMAAIVAASGWVVARAGMSIVTQTPLSATFVGTFFTSVSTSLPELVTAIAAVRAGALTLAVGGIVGGNTFDMLFVGVADVVYQDGSIYAAIIDADIFVLGWTMLLVGVVGAGLVRRERAGIGFEGVAILALYLSGLAVVSTMG